MKVSDLINALRKHDPDADVFVHTNKEYGWFKLVEELPVSVQKAGFRTQPLLSLRKSKRMENEMV